MRRLNPQHVLPGITPVPAATTNSVNSYEPPVPFDRDWGRGFGAIKAVDFAGALDAKVPLGTVTRDFLDVAIAHGMTETDYSRLYERFGGIVAEVGKNHLRDESGGIIFGVRAAKKNTI